MFSNQTPNYGLPQYEQNDTLNVLSDFNGAMETIDSTMKTNELAAASAQSKADGADTKANNNATAITDLQTAQGADRTDINTLTGAVNTINSLIGNGEPTTTDKTLIGAINELHSDAQTDKSNINLIKGRRVLKEIGKADITVTADGTKTYGQLLSSLASGIVAKATALADGLILDIKGIKTPRTGYLPCTGEYHLLGNWVQNVVEVFSGVSTPDATQAFAYTVQISGDNAKIGEYDLINSQGYNHLSDVPTSGQTLTVSYDIIELITWE